MDIFSFKLPPNITELALRLRSGNFTLGEIIHRVVDVSLGILLIGCYRMGYAQAFSDYLVMRTGRRIRLKITSGWRSREYNATIKGAADNSLHIWRTILQGLFDRIISANDFTSPDMTKEELHSFFSDFVQGETYLHRRLGFNHVGDGVPDEDFTV
jgi:hypothetical protein